MGIREKEVEVYWDVCTQIFQKCFLLTEIRQTQSISVFFSVVSRSLHLMLIAAVNRIVV